MESKLFGRGISIGVDRKKVLESCPINFLIRSMNKGFFKYSGYKTSISKKGHPTSLNTTKIKKHIFLATFSQNCKSLIAFC